MALSAGGTKSKRIIMLGVEIAIGIIFCIGASFLFTWQQVNSGENSDHLYVKMNMDLGAKIKYGDLIILAILNNDKKFESYYDFVNLYLHQKNIINDTMNTDDYFDNLSNGEKKSNGYRAFWEQNVFFDLHNCFEEKVEINRKPPECHFNLHTQFRPNTEISPDKFEIYQRVRKWSQYAFKQSTKDRIIFQLMSEFSSGLENLKSVLSREMLPEKFMVEVQREFTDIEDNLEEFEMLNMKQLMKVMVPQENFKEKWLIAILWFCFVYALALIPRIWPTVQTILFPSA